VLSDRPQLLFNYFKQLFAQVTNPPIDPIREELVMSLKATIGSEQNLFEETPRHCHQLELEAPVIGRRGSRQGEGAHARRSACGHVADALPRPRRRGGPRQGARGAVLGGVRGGRERRDGSRLSDRGVDAEQAPIPSLLATAAVHHHLIREGRALACGIVVESGEAREVMHFALLVGYGAGAVDPYLAIETLKDMVASGQGEGRRPEEAVEHYVKAANKGILKVMTKMGISTLQSYRGAQIFEAIGLNRELIDKYFTVDGVAHRGHRARRDRARGRDAHRTRSRSCRSSTATSTSAASTSGGGAASSTCTTRTRSRSSSTRCAPELQDVQGVLGDRERRERAHGDAPRLLKFKPSTRPVPLAEVEPASEIVKRFKTGAMSLGSISREAHENLAIAMNRIGGKSNTGEGGEDPVRYQRDPNGDSAGARSSRWRRAASA
jgi:hypothetical protein